MNILRSHTTPQFEKDFLNLPIKLQKLTARKVRLFEENSLHPGLATHKLKGIIKNFWSFSINKDHRIIFRFLANREVIYYRIGLHKIYKELERTF